MEIERKYLLREDFIADKSEADLSGYKCRTIEQGYLSTDPVVRVRRDNDDYYLTYKSRGFVAREEANLPLTRESYEHLLAKSDGNIITKNRYEIPISYREHMPATICKNNPEHNEFLTIELDVFKGIFQGLVLAEVEFDSIEEADAFTPPDWFGEDVSNDSRYHNSTMSCAKKA